MCATWCSVALFQVFAELACKLLLKGDINVGLRSHNQSSNTENDELLIFISLFVSRSAVSSVPLPTFCSLKSSLEDYISYSEVSS